MSCRRADQVVVGRQNHCQYLLKLCPRLFPGKPLVLIGYPLKSSALNLRQQTLRSFTTYSNHLSKSGKKIKQKYGLKYWQGLMDFNFPRETCMRPLKNARAGGVGRTGKKWIPGEPGVFNANVITVHVKSYLVPNSLTTTSQITKAQASLLKRKRASINVIGNVLSKEPES